jgi:two-component system, LuxR family, response regulator FixJ
MATDGVVHVIDDDEAVLESLAFLLETAGVAARTYGSPLAFLEALPGAEPGCVVTDVRMPEMSGLDLLRRLTDSGRAFPAVVITGHGDVPLAVEAMKLGAVDFIEKPFDDELFLTAIRGALVRGADAGRIESERAAVTARLATLSARERDVLNGLIAGHPNKTIAFDLGISSRTVEVYRANLMAKMQASSLSDLVRMALLADAAVAPPARRAGQA